MTDPVTDADIEDVLASIRRLVLDGRPEPRPAPARPARLVLTPAQRVPPDEGDGEEPFDPEPADDEPAALAVPADAAEPPEAAAGEPMPLFRHARPVHDARPGPDEDAFDDLEPLDERPRAAVDDAALRALVVAVLREELAGELGERITRNVRKLVRREIFRVLASEDER